MELADIARRSLRTLWTHKYLWFFGFFAGGAGGGGGSSGADSTGGGAAAQPPEWVVPAAIGAALLGIVILVMNILCDSALIRGVTTGQQDEKLGIAGGLRQGRRHFWTLALVKLLTLLAFVCSAALVAIPIVLGVMHIVPMVVAVTLVVPLAAVGATATFRSAVWTLGFLDARS